MRRYGYSFIMGSGADYKFSDIIEAIFFGGLLFISLLVLFNPDFTEDILMSFFLLLFVYGLFAIVAEMLPKTSLYLSLLLLSGVYFTAMATAIKHALNHKFDSLFLLNTSAQTLYFLLIALVTVYSIKKAGCN